MKIPSYEPDDNAGDDGMWSDKPLLHNNKGVYNLKVITPLTSHLAPHTSHLTHYMSQAMHDYAEAHANNPQKMWQLAKRNPMGSNRNKLYGNRWPVVRWYDMKEVYMTSLEASRRDKLNFVKALKQRKLALVLDLDETILHSMSGRAEDTPAMRAVARRLKDIGASYSSEILIGEFITKLRPGAREFLAKVNEKFSIYVHTKGKKGYKKWLLSEIDPSGKIFPPGVVDRLASYQDVYVYLSMHYNRFVCLMLLQIWRRAQRK